MKFGTRTPQALSFSLAVRRQQAWAGCDDDAAIGKGPRRGPFPCALRKDRRDGQMTICAAMAPAKNSSAAAVRSKAATAMGGTLAVG